MKKLLGIVVLGLLLTGCETPPPPPKPEIKWVPVTEEDFLKQSIFACWWVPRGYMFEDLSITINLELDRDGYVLEKKILEHERMKKDGEKWYQIFAHSAFKALELCQPLKIPTTNYEEKWKNVQVTFNNPSKRF